MSEYETSGIGYKAWNKNKNKNKKVTKRNSETLLFEGAITIGWQLWLKCEPREQQQQKNWGTNDCTGPTNKC